MAVEKPRPEDRTIIGYDKQGNAKKFELDKLPGGRLPAGFTDEPPPGKHPNAPHEQPPVPQTSERTGERGSGNQEPPKREK